MPSRQGSPNKNKSFLLNRLQKMYGDDFHPIIKIAQNCVTLQERVDEIKVPDIDVDTSADGIETAVAAHKAKVDAIKTANNEWSRIAEYTEPKLKAMELTGADGGSLKLEHSIIEFVPVGNAKAKD